MNIHINICQMVAHQAPPLPHNQGGGVPMLIPITWIPLSRGKRYTPYLGGKDIPPIAGIGYHWQLQKTPPSGLSRELFPKLRTKSTPLSQEIGNMHAGPLYRVAQKECNIIGIVPQSCAMPCLGFIHVVFHFKVRAIMLLSTQLIEWDAVRWNIPAASSLLAGEKVAHFENDTASEK